MRTVSARCCKVTMGRLCWVYGFCVRYSVGRRGFGVSMMRSAIYEKGVIGLLFILSLISKGLCEKSDLTVFKSCNDKMYMEPRNIHQGELELVIRDFENSANRVACDFTVYAGTGEHIMFYFTDIFLGSPNKTDRIDRACMEPRDVTQHFEGIPEGMRALICSRKEVELTPRVYSTKGHALSIRFYRNRGFPITVYVKLVFTAFRTGSCRTTERKCKNDRCISHDLVCNDRNPCGDYSDCPTGLEHLSSFAMCGIVILGLLSGGVIIIMAAVCLQRSSSKNFDIDDFSSVNGVRQPDNTLEMSDVNKKKTSDHDRPQSKDFSSCEKVPNLSTEKIPTCNGVKRAVNDSASCASDKERLIQNGRPLQHDTYLDPFRRSGSDVNMDLFNKTSRGDSDETVTTHMSSLELEEELQSDQSMALMPELVTYSIETGSHNDFRLSGNGMIYTDSDSGGEADYRSREGSFQRQDLLVKAKPSNNSKRKFHSNGKVSQPSVHVFTDFKPSAPHYGYTLSQKNTFDVPISPYKPYGINSK